MVEAEMADFSTKREIPMRTVAMVWLASILCFGVFVPPTALGAEVEWKYFTFFNPNDLTTKVDRAFAQDIEKATNGRLKITVYTAADLPYKFNDTLRLLATNQIQMGSVTIGLNVGELPGLNVFDLPFLCTSFEDYYRAAEPTSAIFEPVLRDKFSIKPLLSYTMPPQQIWFNQPITGIDDLKGKKIRIWSRLQVDMLKRFGASGVSITVAEVTTSLQRRVVDGAITAAAPAYDWHFYEVAKTGYMLDFQLAPVYVSVNVNEFNKLPKDLQAIFQAKIKEWEPKYRKALEEGEVEARRKLAEKGETLVTPTKPDVEKARSVTRPMWEEWAKEGGEVSQKLFAVTADACLGRKGAPSK
jgi:TRAP-type C4-dicarboxylate transport system substrate-binding protein